MLDRYPLLELAGIEDTFQTAGDIDGIEFEGEHGNGWLGNDGKTLSGEKFPPAPVSVPTQVRRACNNSSGVSVAASRRCLL